VFVGLTFNSTKYDTSHEAHCPDLGPACATATPPQPYHHDQTIVTADAVLDAQLGVLRWLAVAINVPLRSNTSRIRYTDEQGRPYEPSPPDTHHRDRTLVGLGDPSVLAIVGRTYGAAGFSVRVGSMLPIAPTYHDDPYRAGREGREHEHVVFGRGIFRPILGANAGVSFGSVGLDSWFAATLSPYAASVGYRPGHLFDLGVRASTGLGLESWRFGLGGEVLHETAESWGGQVNADGNLGRTDVLALGTVRWSMWRAGGVFAAVRVPLWVHVVGAQLTYPAIVQLGVSGAFDL